MLNGNFLIELKRATEARWSKHEINPALYGFQFQCGTRWNPGLSVEEIAEYERVLSTQFPRDFKAFLQVMNGTDIPTLNVYGYCGEPQQESVGVYSYPRDIEIVKQRIEDVNKFRVELTATMADQGFDLSAKASLVPIYKHRYVVCTANQDSSAVISIADGTDAIVYRNSFQEYLEKEFLLLSEPDALTQPPDL
jgi:hypothetical protein